MGGAVVSAPPLPLYLCLHVPEFPAQARLRHRPELRRDAVVILDGLPPLQQVCSTTRKAARAGVTRGMTRAELDSFDAVVMLTRSLPEERSTRRALMALAGAFTPRAQALTGRSGTCAMVLDVTGTETIFGPPQQIVMRVMRALEALGLHGSIAVSHNFHAAVCAAPYAGKNGIAIPHGFERQAMGTLPLNALPLTAEQETTFEMWGLHSCGDLAALPEEELIARLGQDGKRLQLLARGELPHLLVPEDEVFTLEEQVTFESPVEMLDSLLFVLGPMLDQLIQRAGARSLALASVTVKLQLDGAVAQDAADVSAEASEHVRTVKPALPLTDRDLLLKLVHLDLQAHAPSAAVTAIHLSAEPGDRSKVQFGLFSPQLPEPTQLDITLARIAALVGEDRVGRIRLLDTHRSDAFVMERFTSPSSLTARRSCAVARATALRRLRPPVALAMRLHDDRPVAFPLEGKHYAVNEAYGPWRRSGDWWSDAVWAHDEWDVRAATREGDVLLCVLAHDRLRKHWRLEALYD